MHLAARDTSFVLVARAPLRKIETLKKRSLGAQLEHLAVVVLLSSLRQVPRASNLTTSLRGRLVS